MAVQPLMKSFPILLLCLYWDIAPSENFNIETERGTTFNGSRDSYFGQRVAQIESGKKKWIIVSAPLEKNQTGVRTGRVYKCQYTTRSCQPLIVQSPPEAGSISLGLSLASRQAARPQILACGPTLTQQCGTNMYQNGICYLFNDRLNHVARFPPKTQDCFTARVDLAFLIDGSGSIVPEDFARIKDFIVAMLRRFRYRDVQFAVMQFSHLVQKEFNFEEYERFHRNETLVTRIQQIKGDTYTATAIKTLVEDIFVEYSGLREDSKRVMIVITDGQSNDPHTRFPEAIALAQDKQILRFAVGVGPEFQSPKGRHELEIIASNSTNHTVFFIENYDALRTIQDKLQAKIFTIEGTEGMPNMTSFQNEMSQEGFSSILTSDAVVLGTVGGYDWSGGILLYQGDKEVFFNISTSDPDIRNSYLGYSVQEAIRAGIVSYVVGAPRYRHRGEVMVFRKGVNGSWDDVQRIPGEQIGSYFGSELCTLDLTADGETDLLLIGAPLYHDQRVGGIVIICSLSPEGNFSCRGSLRGAEGSGLGRFGSSIAALRDLNGDGIRDVAIGAPLEDEHRGSVYIYHGERSGINPRYSQRIQSAEYSLGLRYFGQAVSGTMDVSGDTLTDLVVGALGTVTVFRSRPVLNVSVTVAFHPGRIPHKAYECWRHLPPNQLISKATVCFEMAKRLPDKLGELKANVTFTMLLDLGRQHSRTTFWTSSRRLTDSLQLDSMRRCQEHVIVLPNCVKDYFKPVELSLNFTVAGEEIPGSNGLRPILDEYGNTTHSYQLPFERDCGWDNECTDYLRVFFNFSGGDTVVVRRDAVLTVLVLLENALEDSYKTQLIVYHPGRLSFKKISEVQPSSVYIECGDLQYHSWIERATLTCSVNHPVFAKASRVTFKANFDLSTSGAEKQTAGFNIRATSQNTRRIANESTFSRTIFLRYAVDLAASGAGYTRDVNFTTGQQDTRLVKHSYQVENLGHRSLPITVTFTFPARISARLLWNVTLSEREPGNCSVCLPPVESVAPMEGERRKEPEDQIRLDCGIAMCLVVQCTVAALEDHGKVIFDLQGELMSAAVAELKAKKLQLPSKVRLSYDGEKYVDILDPTGQYKEATVMTEVDIFEPVSRLPMIVGGSIAGLVLLLILMVVFYKLGFFKRRTSSRDRDSLRGNTSENGEGPSAEGDNRQE